MRPARVRGIAGGTALWAIAALLLLAPAAAANDLGLSVDPVEEVNGAIAVSYRVETPWTPRLTETLLRGMPATVIFEVGLWKRRAFWFDKLVLAIRSEHKVLYDPWDRAFRVRSGPVRRKSRMVPTLDSLETVLFSERQLALVPPSALDPEARYYVSVRVTIRPLSAEDLDEVEDWLSGEAKNPDRPERGVPGYLLGIAANISGLGDRTALARSESFRPSLLEAPQ
ncbi:MAG TPA: DUF4390 domain-containing protein [Candidatus Limnocylindrales bacterium]|nr:DUF4390 domain-containing protein [Candidatus Limnocylindrales bacterium]